MRKVCLSAGSLTLLLALLTGCHTPPALPRLGPRYHPSNVYLRSPLLPPDIRRVALLPIAPSVQSEAFQAGIDNYQPLLESELDKAKRFDVVVVSPALLARLTGQPRWTGEEKLTADFFDKLHDETGCQAVFFAELTRYQPYQPLAVGWKLNLVADADKASLWSADEVFDAGNGEVADSARDYEEKDVRYEGALADPDAILSSPSRFGQYTLHALLLTLPAR
jgi:hypothetical protein